MKELSAKDFPRIENSTKSNSDLFDQCSIRIAVQKDGELTTTSLKILKELFQINFSAPTDRQLITIEDDGNIGIIWAKNKSICELVKNEAVDIAILGSDQLLENASSSDGIIQIESFEHIVQWPLVLAVGSSQPKSINDIKTIATQFPITTKKILDDLGVNAEIIRSEGSTEAYVYLNFAGKRIDAITDISVTGNTLKKNNLTKWGPALFNFYPVLIANPKGKDKFTKKRK